MGLFKAVRGTDLTPDEAQAIKSLEATLPDGWRFKELRRQLVGRRPVKHETYGAVVKGPDRSVVAIALDGVSAVQAVASAVPGPAATSRQWAPPPITAVDYARAACGELSMLLDDESPNEREIAETLARAAAKTDRAATVDKAFLALDEDLDRLDAAVAKPDGLTEREETAANDSTASLAEACADSAAVEGQSPISVL